MALIGKVCGMRMCGGKSISEISRVTSLSRNTIKKWLQTQQGVAPQPCLEGHGLRATTRSPSRTSAGG